MKDERVNGDGEDGELAWAAEGEEAAAAATGAAGAIPGCAAQAAGPSDETAATSRWRVAYFFMMAIPDMVCARLSPRPALRKDKFRWIRDKSRQTTGVGAVLVS